MLDIDIQGTFNMCHAAFAEVDEILSIDQYFSYSLLS